MKYATFAARICAELRQSDRAFALDYIHLSDDLTAREWLTIREESR